MEYPKYRLFDSINHQLKNFPKENTLNAKINGEWKSFSSQYIHDITNKLAAALYQKNISGKNFTVEACDKIAIISANRPEWVFVDLAVQKTGAVLIPIYPTTGEKELAFILNESEAKYIFVGDAGLLDKVKSVNSPHLKDIYSFDTLEGCKHYSELVNEATDSSISDIIQYAETIPHTHIATIIYTSGTTGVPKGVMLAHENIVSNIYFSKASFPFPDQPQTRVLSFLPLNHIFEKMITYLYLFSGIGIYYAESIEKIGDNLKELKVDGFTTVPRLLEKVYEKIMAKGNELTGFKRSLFFWSVNIGKQYDINKSGGFLYDLKLKIANALIFTKWREALGGNISFIITGGAAASEKLLRIFNAAKIPIYEGYGPTENSPVICVNRFTKGGSELGTVGPPIDGIEVKLAEDNEILVKGASVMRGYYKRQDLTDDVIKDGWLYTGDIGTWIDNKYIKITDRKKELLKTSGGKYVAPQPIENKLKESRFIEQVIVVGDDKKFVSALIVPSFTALQSWVKEKEIDISTDNASIIKSKDVIDLIQHEIDRANINFNHVEQVKKFALLPAEWSIEGGEMTPKLSLKRKIILEKYSHYIDNIYE
ncbi:MAG: long-chain fatty acid--CoA ligase [Chitinophagaceae bacterium]|nr:MAG: long-chain fatty acid--CoA ligase [Chitinophagaceae bacterium]